MSRADGRFALALALTSLVACGGASKPAADATSASSGGPTAENVSIGDTAVAQGGLTSLGGGNNRSAAEVAAAMSLHFDRVDKDSPVKMDGSLREWSARAAAKKVVRGDASKTAFS